MDLVYLHGMAGCHLRRPADGHYVWLAAGALWRGSLGGDLAGPLEPAGHLRLVHSAAAAYWRWRGARVHEFSYDWRQSLDHSAAALARWIEQRLPAPRRYRVAAHSMGGCVVLRMAALFPEVAGRVDSALLYGAPVRGTFAAVEVLLGRFLLTRLVARAAAPGKRQQTLETLCAATAAMPGMTDLLPDPAFYPSAALLYQSARWPAHCRPPQPQLDASLRTRQAMRAPLPPWAVVAASPAWPTPCEAALDARGEVMLTPRRAPGDRVTLLDSATAGGQRPHTPLRLPHGFLLYEPAAWRAAMP
ncbi:MAG: hypothetical protein IT162_21055 [Bryobacterales bacterium]|nr:hypothetical protein [Bryobacterales bacterium]